MHHPPPASMDTCFWKVGREARSPALPVAGDVKVDVAVIGAGYTGLSTAYHLRAADPALSVAVLEGETVGFGASGRNGGFVMTLFGSSVGLMHLLHGKQKVRQANDYMESCIDALDAFVAEHHIDCDWRRTGFLRVATTPTYEKRIRDEMAFQHSLGIEGLEWVDGDWLAARVRSPKFRAACWEPGCGSLNPIKWVDGLARIAVAAGARLFERSPVKKIERLGSGYRLFTPDGTVEAEKIVYATNGYTHLVPGMRFRQTPAFAYIVVTEPLSPAQLEKVGWQGREAIEDGRNFMHFFRLTPDNRILAGGGPGLVPFGGNMDHDAYPKAFDHLEHFIAETFPGLGPVRIAHRWGGAFSATADFTPAIGTLDGGRAAYSFGCTGHGVAMTHMNGRILRDLVLERRTELSSQWFVNRFTLPMPPEPIRSAAIKTVMGAMALDDWWCDRK